MIHNKFTFLVCFLLLFSCAKPGEIDNRSMKNGGNLAEGVVPVDPDLGNAGDPLDNANPVVPLNTPSVDSGPVVSPTPVVVTTDTNDISSNPNSISTDDDIVLGDSTVYCTGTEVALSADLDCDGTLNDSDNFPEDPEAGACDFFVPSDANSITELVSDSNNADSLICVNEGRYYENISLELPINVKVYCLDQNLGSNETYACTLDGSEKDRVLKINSGSITAKTVISGFNIEYGRRLGYGGGIFVTSGADPTLKNLRFYKNETYCDADGDGTIDTTAGDVTSCHGGALAVSNSDIIGKNLSFESNKSAGNGGALYFYKSTSVLDKLTAYRNFALKKGGGAFIQLGDGTNITNSLFSKNQSFGDGAGMCSYNTGNLTLANSSFLENETLDDEDSTTYQGKGGGLSITGGGESGESIFLYNMLFTKNLAVQRGGAISLQSNSGFVSYTLYSSNLTIVDNSSWVGGGAIQVGYSSDDSYAALKIYNSIIQNNTSNFITDDLDSNGDEISVERGDNILFVDSISAENSSISYSNVGCLTGGVEDKGYGVCRSGTYKNEDENNINESSPFEDTDSYELKNGSYSIDSGISEVKMFVPVDMCKEYLDLNGESRCSDGDADGLTGIDMGAYEFQSQE